MPQTLPRKRKRPPLTESALQAIEHAEVVVAIEDEPSDHPGADTLSVPTWDEAGVLRWTAPRRGDA